MGFFSFTFLLRLIPICITNTFRTAHPDMYLINQLNTDIFEFLRQNYPNMETNLALSQNPFGTKSRAQYPFRKRLLGTKSLCSKSLFVQSPFTQNPFWDQSPFKVQNPFDQNPTWVQNPFAKNLFWVQILSPKLLSG